MTNHGAISKMQMIKVLNDLNNLDLDFSGCETSLSVLRVTPLTNQEFDHLEIIIRKIYKEETIMRILRFVKSMWRLQVGNESIISVASLKSDSHLPKKFMINTLFVLNLFKF